jgi:hypothetical protein
MSLSEDVRPLLASRAASDPNAARLLEMFTKADEILSKYSLGQIGDVEMAHLAQMHSGVLCKYRHSTNDHLDRSRQASPDAVAAETYLTTVFRSSIP